MILIVLYNLHAMFHFLFFTVLFQIFWFIHFSIFIQYTHLPLSLLLLFFNNSVSVYYFGSNFHLIFLLFVCFCFSLFYFIFLASIILHVFAWLSWNQTWLIFLAKKKSHIWAFFFFLGVGGVGSINHLRDTGFAFYIMFIGGILLFFSSGFFFLNMIF